jgi:hypothetical protein
MVVAGKGAREARLFKGVTEVTSFLAPVSLAASACGRFVVDGQVATLSFFSPLSHHFLFPTRLPPLSPPFSSIRHLCYAVREASK